jgi:superfamily II DNA or RNA helicase
MTGYVPRDYQLACIEAIFGDFIAGKLSTLCVMATGVGKTEVYLQVAERFLEENPGQRCLVIAHREELISQPARRWKRNREEWPAIEMGEQRANQRTDQGEMFEYAPTNDRIVLASIQSLNSGKRCVDCTADCQDCAGNGKLLIECGCEEGCENCKGSGKIKAKCRPCKGDGWICTLDDCMLCFEHFIRRMQKFDPQEFGLIIVDEAHHIIADSFTRTVRYFRNKRPRILLLGFTATPDRTDEEALGQVFESVAYEYSLPAPIYDGWLTPVDQQFITVEDLNLANVRVTAGDLNSGDLEREMTAEKVLHKVTTPLVEIACGMKQGTIDELITRNEIHRLPEFCKRHEPTLVHCVDVAHAERTTEIINRYLPGSALCIIGTTDKTIRRDGLKRFAEGGYQFLLSCGVFLEGTDLPNVSVIGMARPTKSRALYAQMLGRGLRPMPGLVDGIPDAETRCKAIAQSRKPKCLVIDFAGNSGKHKLISAADILGNELPDELVSGVIRKAAISGQPVDILKALAAEKAAQEEEARKQARAEAQRREAKQAEADKRAAQRRQGIVAGANYTTQSINPFDVMDVARQREPGWHKGRMPSEAMKESLRKAKIPFTEQTTFWEAHLLIDAMIKRRKENKCTYSQAKTLQKHGYSGNETFDEASKLIDAIAKNGWKRPPDKPDIFQQHNTAPSPDEMPF